MQRLGVLAKTYAIDVVIVVLVLVGMVDTVLARNSAGSPNTSLWFALPAMAVLAIVIVAHRRFPFAGPAAYWVLGAAIAFIDPILLPAAESFFAVGLATAFLLGSLRDARKAGIGLAIILASTAILVSQIPGHTSAEVVFIPIDFAICWFAGFVFRRSADQAQAAETRALVAERDREADALRAVVEERTRIARELHDIVGHSLSVMTVQTSGVRRLLRPEQEQEREALLAVERTGREALAEMRRVVGALRDPNGGPALAPQPSLSRVDALVAHARETGLPVDLEIEGDPVPLPPGVDLTAYRLVQEGLTNAIKHASPGHAEVHVRYDDGYVEIEVCDDGRGADGIGAAAGGSGHGLVGMRERVSIYGGELDAGPRAEGGFRLHARLPVTA
ncbi:MAG TPA: sensor histidine kinase [Actinomycetota bacterium]|jgi:signal transduction histidine kinase|nr:sensor histidine kinase [Actinomycetota bacterium]